MSKTNYVSHNTFEKWAKENNWLWVSMREYDHETGRSAEERWLTPNGVEITFYFSKDNEPAGVGAERGTYKTDN